LDVVGIVLGKNPGNFGIDVGMERRDKRSVQDMEFGMTMNGFSSGRDLAAMLGRPIHPWFLNRPETWKPR
jgi:hypothetical protein